jgi:opacity protein-like surface antigen
MRGGMAGIQFGYNFAGAGPLFAGAELALYGADLEQRSESSDPSAPNRERITNIRNPFYATVRLGFAGSRTLVYVRGGYSHADVELEAINHQVGNIAAWQGHANGWTAGTGFEVRVNPRWSLGLGYDFSRLRATNLETTNSGGVAVHADDFTARVHALLLRANYRF